MIIETAREGSKALSVLLPTLVAISGIAIISLEILSASLRKQIRELKEKLKTEESLRNHADAELVRAKIQLQKFDVPLPEEKVVSKKLPHVGIRIHFKKEANLEPKELRSVNPTGETPFKQYIHFIRWFNDRERSEHYTWKLVEDQAVLLLKSIISQIELFRLEAKS
jgi:hypothetical protein